MRVLKPRWAVAGSTRAWIRLYGTAMQHDTDALHAVSDSVRYVAYICSLASRQGRKSIVFAVGFRLGRIECVLRINGIVQLMPKIKWISVAPSTTGLIYGSLIWFSRQANCRSLTFTATLFSVQRRQTVKENPTKFFDVFEITAEVHMNATFRWITEQFELHHCQAMRYQLSFPIGAVIACLLTTISCQRSVVLRYVPVVSSSTGLELYAIDEPSVVGPTGVSSMLQCAVQCMESLCCIMYQINTALKRCELFNYLPRNYRNASGCCAFSGEPSVKIFNSDQIEIV